MRASAIQWMVGCLVTALLSVTVVNVFAQARAQSTAPLPPAVQRAFQQSYPGATILAAFQERDRDRSVFRVDSVDKGAAGSSSTRRAVPRSRSQSRWTRKTYHARSPMRCIRTRGPST
jgi:hypothetical protein